MVDIDHNQSAAAESKLVTVCATLSFGIGLCPSLKGDPLEHAGFKRAGSVGFCAVEPGLDESSTSEVCRRKCLSARF